MALLYALTFASGRRYVGVTVRTLARRLRNHERAAAAGSPYPVHRAWRKHGAPAARVLAVAPAGAFLLDLERRAIAAFGTFGPGGYNANAGGEAMGLPEARERNAAANRGKKRSDETRARISAALSGRRLSPEHRAKAAVARLGKPHDSASLAKIRAAQVGRPARPHTPESRAKLSAAASRRRYSKEARARMSASRRGRAISPAGRARMSEAALRRWEKVRAS